MGYSPWGHKEPDTTERSEMLPDVHWEDKLRLGENMELYLINKTTWASLEAQVVKNPPAMQETPGQFLGQEDPLEKT